MTQICIRKSRINSLSFLDNCDKETIQIGVPNTDDRARLLGLKFVGDVVLPSAEFGPKCRKNAYGYSYADKTLPKNERYISTVWVHPFGNVHANSVACDIYKKCYPKVEVPPLGIEVMLFKTGKGDMFIMADLNSGKRRQYLKEAINIFLEIFNECYVFLDEIVIDESIKKQKCNWEILPPGEKPSIHIYNQLKGQGKETDTFDLKRLCILDKYNAEQIVEGVNGFAGYYAYIFKNYCVFESAKYGNATYIVPQKNWEIYSQMTKNELFEENVVIEKLIHNENWVNNIKETINRLEKNFFKQEV